LCILIQFLGKLVCVGFAVAVVEVVDDVNIVDVGLVVDADDEVSVDPVIVFGKADFEMIVLGVDRVKGIG
jgi:hypothetical protein